VLAGSIKGAYDLILWRWFSRVRLPDDSEPTHDDLRSGRAGSGTAAPFSVPKEAS
jgi:hypothetical protein